MIRPLVLNDVRVQFRSGFHLAYAFVCASYILLLRLLQADLRALILPPVLLSETSVVGFFFAGALLHFERGDGVLRALAVTPVSTRSLLTARVLSLSLLCAAVALVIPFGAGVPVPNPAALAAGALLAGVLFTLAGTAVASRFHTIDRFVVLGGMVSALLGLPVLPFFGILESPLWRVLPTDALLRLFAVGTGVRTLSGVDAVSALAVLAIWCGVAAALARRWVDRFGIGRAA